MLHPYWIAEINGCQVGISPCPAGQDQLKAELSSLLFSGKTILISALPEREVGMLGLQDEEALCAQMGIRFINLPITDTSIPGSGKFTRFIDELYALTYPTDRMVIHCRAGIGRSSLIALGLMIKHGFPLAESIRHASKIRGFEVPQSRSQSNLLSWYAQSQG